VKYLYLYVEKREHIKGVFLDHTAADRQLATIHAAFSTIGINIFIIFAPGEPERV